MPAITLNGLSCVSLRVVIPAIGAWYADVDVDLLSLGADPASLTAPSGPVAIVIAPDDILGTPTTLLGTVDANASGRFAGAGRLRVVGGGGGWATSLPRQQFAQQPLTSTVLYAATAAAVGELPPVDPLPDIFVEGYERMAGPASRVFGDRPWHVDPTTGVVQVIPWPPSPPPSDLDVLGFDANMQRFEAASSTLLLPGMPLVDTQLPPRWDGVLTVAEVEQTFSPAHGNRASLWISAGSAPRLISALQNLVREASRRDLSRAYRYRVVAQTGAMLTLQAVDSTAGAPDSVNVPVWTAPGVAAMWLPSQEVLVVFADGNPGLPRVIVGDVNLPLTTTVDAVTSVAVGPTALATMLAGGALGPLALGSAFATMLAALAAAVPSMTETGFASFQTAMATAFATTPFETTKVTGA